MRHVGAWAACIVAIVVASAPADAARSRHVRLVTDNGPVHVWRPAGYAPRTAGIVVYVHGYFTGVDRAWREHRLARQFARSRINALFIVPEAPLGPEDPIAWPQLNDLLADVAARLGGALPGGRIVAVGHSGAHRTLSLWATEELVDTFVLVDAIYGDKPEFVAWLEGDPDRRLIDAAQQTRPWTDALHATLADTLVFERFPRGRKARLRGARGARVVYVRSQIEHMDLVTGGEALPTLLRALRLASTGASPRDRGRHRQARSRHRR